jgi:tetratricopeptide (TPR) repeat protein
MAVRDIRGLPMTAASAAAVARFDDVMAGYLGFRVDVGDRLKAALAEDPECPLVHCARGYFTLLLNVRRLVARAQEALAAARAAAAQHGATPREAAHLDALAAWCAGDADKALGRWEAILADHPRDVMALKLAQFWHFYLGDARAMLQSVARALPAWDDGVPGHGYVLGLKAFGFEECGDYAAAERTGRRAVEIDPADAWAIHAVAHVHEMRDEPQAGIAWIDGLTPHLAGCNNFRFHVWWHRCLFHLELGEADTVLGLYDREVRAESTGDYLDICNATSLLWRLEDLGVDVGNRWAELAAQTATRIDDHMLVFADAHFSMALAAAGGAAAGRMIESARAYAGSGETEARVMTDVGAAVCEAMVAHRERRFGRVIDLLTPLRGRLASIGGSHAQRDLFDKVLISACLGDGRRTAARDLIQERLRQRPANRWAQQALARAA